MGGWVNVPGVHLLCAGRAHRQAPGGVGRSVAEGERQTGADVPPPPNFLRLEHSSNTRYSPISQKWSVEATSSLPWP